MRLAPIANWTRRRTRPWPVPEPEPFWVDTASPASAYAPARSRQITFVPGVFAQPGGQRVGLSISQHVHRPMGGHVDQDRAVAPIAPQREVVHPQHRYRTNLG